MQYSLIASLPSPAETILQDSITRQTPSHDSIASCNTLNESHSSPASVAIRILSRRLREDPHTMKRLAQLRIRRQQRAHRIRVALLRRSRIANLDQPSGAPSHRSSPAPSESSTPSPVKWYSAPSAPFTTSGASALMPSDSAGGAAAALLRSSTSPDACSG